MVNVYIVKWGQRIGDTYTHGSKINFHESSVSFSNPEQSPGESIHTWYSLAEFRKFRYTPALPILTPGHQYHFRVDLTQEPADSLNLAITYFDDDDEQIRQDFFTELNDSFAYPENGHHYQMDLINLNNQQLEFTSLWLADEELLQTWEIERQKLASGTQFVTATQPGFSQWSVTLAAEEIDTTIFPFYPGENNVVLAVPTVGLSDKDLIELLNVMYQHGLQRDAPLIVRVFGSDKILFETQKVFATLPVEIENNDKGI